MNAMNEREIGEEFHQRKRKNAYDDAMKYNRTNEINDSYIYILVAAGVIHLREYTYSHFYCTSCGRNRDRKLMIEHRIMMCSEDRLL